MVHQVAHNGVDGRQDCLWLCGRGAKTAAVETAELRRRAASARSWLFIHRDLSTEMLDVCKLLSGEWAEVESVRRY